MVEYSNTLCLKKRVQLLFLQTLLRHIEFNNFVVKLYCCAFKFQQT